MAEFCKDCAKSLGMKQADETPLFCENCQTYYDKEPKNYANTIIVILLLITIVSILQLVFRLTQ